MPDVTITLEPSGAVVARGADDLSAALLRHAGFTEHSDWHGRRHRLVSTMAPDEQSAVVGSASAMLRAARYQVVLDPRLDSTEIRTPTDPFGRYIAGHAVLAVADRMLGTDSVQTSVDMLDQLLNANDGVLVRLQEALDTAAETVRDFGLAPDVDHEAASELADRLEAAAEHLTTVSRDLENAPAAFRGLHAPGPRALRTGAAKAASPATLTAPAASSAPAPAAAPLTAPSSAPSRTPRAR